METSKNSIWSKSNELSSALLNTAAIFQRSNYHEVRCAIESCTRALCCAETGTDHVPMAFENRANCFYQLELYGQALADIELAFQAGCTENSMLKLEEIRVDCQQMKGSIRTGQSMAESIRKLDLEADQHFPCIANVLTIANNKRFGRHIIARCDIGVGQTVLVEEYFASVSDSEAELICYTCMAKSKNFIPCPYCADVVFCSRNCMRLNVIHKMDCNTTYHRMPLDVQFTIRTILIAVSMFDSNIDNLMALVEHSFDSSDLPESATELQSKYRLFLKLQKFPRMGRNATRETFRMIMTIQLIEDLFDSAPKQRFLEKLLSHHSAIIGLNSFGDETSTSISVVASLLNHSCLPNLLHKNIGNWIICKTARPIMKGEQLFISYLGDCNEPTEWRQKELQWIFQFECECPRCSSTSRPNRTNGTLNPLNPFNDFNQLFPILYTNFLCIISGNFRQQSTIAEELSHCVQCSCCCSDEFVSFFNN